LKTILTLFAVLLLSVVPFAYADSAMISVDPSHVNATINTPTSATLNWQFTGWNATQCDFQNISWNEGKGKQQNPSETVNATGSGHLSIFGWHIFDIQLLATCGIGTTDGTNSTLFGPFDVTIEGITPPESINNENIVLHGIIGGLAATATGLGITLLRKNKKRS